MIRFVVASPAGTDMKGHDFRLLKRMLASLRGNTQDVAGYEPPSSFSLPES